MKLFWDQEPEKGRFEAVCVFLSALSGVVWWRLDVSGGIIRVNQASSSLVKTRSHRILSRFVSFLCQSPFREEYGRR